MGTRGSRPSRGDDRGHPADPRRTTGAIGWGTDRLDLASRLASRLATGLATRLTTDRTVVQAAENATENAGEYGATAGTGGTT